MNRLPRALLVSLLACSFSSPLLADQPAKPGLVTTSRNGLSDSEYANAKEMLQKATDYLRLNQDAATGGWSINPKGPSFPAITGLVVSGLATQATAAGRAPESDTNIAQGVKYMLNNQQKDGGIYDKALPSYNTSICLTALVKINTPQAKAAIKPAQDFLRTLQYSEEAVVYDGMRDTATKTTKDNAYYGGFGYGGGGRPDVSNTAWVLEALHASGVESSDPAFQRALVFLQRTQMTESRGGMKINEMEYAKGSNQGGFIYSTSVNKDRAGVGQSMAGEIIESGSEGPGTEATITLKNGADGKRMTLKKSEIEQRITEQFNRSSDMEVSGSDKSIVVALGPSSDGISAGAFTVRTAVKDAKKAEMWLGMAFHDVVENSDAIRVKAVKTWKGVSHLRAYGSMTYSGFKSYLYANLGRDDARVAAAREWIARNYTLGENPGFGTEGLYYYFVVFGRAMSAWGEPVIATEPSHAEKVERRWAADLIARLGELQEADGSFKSVNSRWQENDKVLITSYSVLALEEAMGLGK